MFFVLKSVLWLGLVFYCMSWPGGEGPGPMARKAAGDWVQQAQSAAVESAMSACKSNPARCLSLAKPAAQHQPADDVALLRGMLSD